MSENHTVNELIGLAIEGESIAALLYRGFARKFSDSPSASNFWTNMALEEATHIKFLTNIRDKLSDDRLNSKVEPDIVLKAREILKYSPDDLLQSTNSMEDALDISHALENSEVNSVFRYLTRTFVDNEEVTEYALAQLGEHLGRLMEFSEEYKHRVQCGR
jgi:rubrerythrin